MNSFADVLKISKFEESDPVQMDVSDTIVPYYWQSVNWQQLMDDYPPEPLYRQKNGRLGDEEIRALQNSRFLARVAEGWNVPFYANRWRAVGLEPGDIRSLDDITKIPSFTSDDLKDAIAEHPPFGSHQPMTKEDFARTPWKIHTSGGTTGFPRMTLFDPRALEVQGIQAARAMWAQGSRPGDTVQITYTMGLTNAAYCATYACHHWLGAIPLNTGSGLITPSEKQLEYALKVGTRAWFGRGEYFARLADVAQEIGFDLRSLKTGRLHAFLGTDTNNVLRKALEDAWGCPVYDNYGTHEVGHIAYECEAQDGRHVAEDTAYVEVQDVETGKPLGFGETGNMVITSLYRTAPLMIRYDLRDLMKIYPRQQCSCGLCSTKLSSFLGRSDEMVKLRGTNVYPMACQPAVREDPRLTGEFICVAFTEGEGLSARTEMAVRVERRSPEIDKAAIVADLQARLHKDLSVKVKVEVFEKEELAPLIQIGSTGKTRRLLDLRTMK